MPYAKFKPHSSKVSASHKTRMTQRKSPSKYKISLWSWPRWMPFGSSQTEQKAAAEGDILWTFALRAITKKLKKLECYFFLFRIFKDYLVSKTTFVQDSLYFMIGRGLQPPIIFVIILFFAKTKLLGILNKIAVFLVAYLQMYVPPTHS